MRAEGIVDGKSPVVLKAAVAKGFSSPDELISIESRLPKIPRRTCWQDIKKKKECSPMHEAENTPFMSSVTIRHESCEGIMSIGLRGFDEQLLIDWLAVVQHVVAQQKNQSTRLSVLPNDDANQHLQPASTESQNYKVWQTDIVNGYEGLSLWNKLPFSRRSHCLSVFFWFRSSLVCDTDITLDLRASTPLYETNGSPLSSTAVHHNSNTKPGRRVNQLLQSIDQKQKVDSFFHSALRKKVDNILRPASAPRSNKTATSNNNQNEFRHQTSSNVKVKHNKKHSTTPKQKSVIASICKRSVENEMKSPGSSRVKISPSTSVVDAKALHNLFQDTSITDQDRLCILHHVLFHYCGSLVNSSGIIAYQQSLMFFQQLVANYGKDEMSLEDSNGSKLKFCSQPNSQIATTIGLSDVSVSSVNLPIKVESIDHFPHLQTPTLNGRYYRRLSLSHVVETMMLQATNRFYLESKRVGTKAYPVLHSSDVYDSIMLWRETPSSLGNISMKSSLDKFVKERSDLAISFRCTSEDHVLTLSSAALEFGAEVISLQSALADQDQRQYARHDGQGGLQRPIHNPIINESTKLMLLERGNLSSSLGEIGLCLAYINSSDIPKSIQSADIQRQIFQSLQLNDVIWLNSKDNHIINPIIIDPDVDVDVHLDNVRHLDDDLKTQQQHGSLDKYVMVHVSDPKNKLQNQEQCSRFVLRDETKLLLRYSVGHSSLRGELSVQACDICPVVFSRDHMVSNSRQWPDEIVNRNEQLQLPRLFINNQQEIVPSSCCKHSYLGKSQFVRHTLAPDQIVATNNNEYDTIAGSWVVALVWKSTVLTDFDGENLLSESIPFCESRILGAIPLEEGNDAGQMLCELQLQGGHLMGMQLQSVISPTNVQSFLQSSWLLNVEQPLTERQDQDESTTIISSEKPLDQTIEENLRHHTAIIAKWDRAFSQLWNRDVIKVIMIIIALLVMQISRSKFSFNYSTPSSTSPNIEAAIALSRSSWTQLSKEKAMRDELSWKTSSIDSTLDDNYWEVAVGIDGTVIIPAKLDSIDNQFTSNRDVIVLEAVLDKVDPEVDDSVSALLKCDTSLTSDMESVTQDVMLITLADDNLESLLNEKDMCDNKSIATNVINAPMSGNPEIVRVSIRKANLGVFRKLSLGVKKVVAQVFRLLKITG
jgi:hypothetical protein